MIPDTVSASLRGGDWVKPLLTGACAACVWQAKAPLVAAMYFM